MTTTRTEKSNERDDVPRETSASTARALLDRVAASPAGKRILGEAGVSAQSADPAADFARLPILPRSDLARWQQEYPDRAGFATIPLRDFGRLGYHAGGEVDVAYAGRHGADVMADLFGRLGVTSSDVVVNTFGYHLATVAHVFDEGLRRLGACVVPAGPGNSALQLELFTRLRPTVWLGFPTFLWRTLTDAGSKDTSLRLAIVGGEFAPGVRRELHRQFGIDSRDFYGVSILGPAAYECAEKEGMHVTERMLVEIVDRDTRAPVAVGEAGEIVLTPLDHEYVVPRLGTGDLSRWLDEPCRCGDPSDRIAGVLGRVGEGVKVRGVFVYPRDVRSVRQALPADVEVALVVSRATDGGIRDILTLRVTPGKGPPPEGFEASVGEVFHDVCHVRLDEVTIVPELGTDSVLVDQREWEVAAP